MYSVTSSYFVLKEDIESNGHSNFSTPRDKKCSSEMSVLARALIYGFAQIVNGGIFN